MCIIYNIYPKCLTTLRNRRRIEKSEDLVNDDATIEILNNTKRVLEFGEGVKGFDYKRYKKDRWREDWHFNIGDIK